MKTNFYLFKLTPALVLVGFMIGCGGNTALDNKSPKGDGKKDLKAKLENEPPQNAQSDTLATFLTGKRVVFRTQKNQEGFYQFEKENYLTIGLIREGELFEAPIPYYFDPAYKVYGLEMRVWDIPDLGSANETRLVFSSAEPEVGDKIVLKQKVAIPPNKPLEGPNGEAEKKAKEIEEEQWKVLDTYTVTRIEPSGGPLKQTPEFQRYMERVPKEVRAKNNTIKSGNVASSIRGYLRGDRVDMPATGQWCDVIMNIMKGFGASWPEARRLFSSPQLPQSSKIEHELRVSDHPDKLPQVSHYAMNKSVVGQPIAKIFSAGNKVVIFECELGWNGEGGLEDALKYMDKYKLDRIGVAFMDGSRQTPDREELKKLKW